jgi:CRP-like cAMP-binding protein
MEKQERHAVRSQAFVCLCFCGYRLEKALRYARCRNVIAQRLSRWLLLCADRSESSVLQLTHQYLGDMLGTNRSTVSSAAAQLQSEGLIEYSRGKVTITDRSGLEARSCE